MNSISIFPCLRDIQHNKIEIQPIRYVTLEELIASLDNKIFDEQFQKSYSQLLQERIFIFKVIYMGKSWEIRKTLKQFETLEYNVTNNALYYFFKSKFINDSILTKEPSIILTYLHKYLQILISNEQIPQSALNFLEISAIDLPLKIKEGYMLKMKGGRYNQSYIKSCEVLFARWQKRYFIITQQAILYMKGPEKHNCAIRECLSFDSNFTFLYGHKETGEHNKIIIQFSQRKLEIKAENVTDYVDFIFSLFFAIKQSPYTKIHRFGSFAPIRTSNCQWYVDGKDYFEDVCSAILSAKETIYITDWWLSPEVYLKRPVDARPYAQQNENTKFRLDLMLKEAADRGIIVLILVYNASTIALTLDSRHTKQTLEKLSPNIKVIKHPSQKIPKLFSHHEKMVLIDEQIAFMGGLDLCFGRWDTNEHVLFEKHHIERFWPQIDYSNTRIRDFVNVQNFQNSLLRENEPRMPWHDIAIRVQGDTAVDLARHFTQYWNHVIMEKYGSTHKTATLIHAKDIKIEEYIPNSELKNSCSVTSSVIYQEKKEQEIQMKKPLLLQPIVTTPEGIQIEMNNQKVQLVDQIETVHQTKFNGSNIAKFMVQQYFEQKKELYNNNKELSLSQMLNKQNEDEDEEDNECYHKLTEKKLNKLPEKKQFHTQQLASSQSHSLLRGSYCVNYFFPKLQVDDSEQSCITQLTRSSCKWSTGINIKENSIQSAYLQLIELSSKFIYIENQFFISRSAGSSVKNLIANALINRIIRAYNNKERFKVIVFIPLLPGFEGEIDSNNSAVLKVQLHWEYNTISRGGTSIIERLSEKGITPSDYIEFFSLRQHQRSPPPFCNPVTEIIYIHSKLMIVDDEIALIGSANINDRSLNGNRDSELAIIVQDQTRIQSKMNDQNLDVAKFARSLRTALYMEHFGLSEEQVIDPLSAELELEIRARTAANTKAYRQIFACYPDDEIQSISQLEAFKNAKDLSKYDELVNQIKGHAVEFPLNFLCKENLQVKVFSKEYLAPDKSFT